MSTTDSASNEAQILHEPESEPTCSAGALSSGSSQDRKERQKHEKRKPLELPTDPFWLAKVFPDELLALTYSPPSVREIFDTSVFIFDANTLLAPYEVGKQSVAEVERIYKRLAEQNRLFVPEQAAREFAKHRGRKLTEVYDKVHAIASKLPSMDAIDCPMLEGTEELTRLSDLKSKFDNDRNVLRETLGSLKLKLAEWGWSDRVSTLYKSVFTANRIVKHDKDNSSVLQDLQWQFAHKVPPGYKDSGKPDLGIGDVLVWNSILNLGSKAKTNVIFICNEQKHDWVYRSNKEPLIPRLELSYQFRHITNHDFGLVSWNRFLELAGAGIETIEEAKRVERRPTTQVTPDPYGSLWSSLEEIHDLLQNGPQDFGSGYRVVPTDDLLDRINSFRAAMSDHFQQLLGTKCFGILNRIAHVLDDIMSLGKQLDYIETRMKRTGDTESDLLATKCQHFLKLFDELKKLTFP